MQAAKSIAVRLAVLIKTFRHKQGLAFIYAYARLNRRPRLKWTCSSISKSTRFSITNGASVRTRGIDPGTSPGSPAVSKCSLMRNVFLS